MKNISLILVLSLVVAACGKKDANELEKKREELTKSEASLDSIKKAIAELKDQIEELDTAAKSNAVPVRVAEIGKKSFENSFQIQGLIESDKNVMISPEVPGNITRIYVREGQRVSKGQIIASLDGSSASSQIAELENALSLAKINYEKQTRLWNKKIGSEMQYLQAKNQYENLQKSLATANTQLGKYTMRSTISGTVDEIMANEGELVGSLTGGAVARIVDLRDIKIKVNVSEKYLTNMKRGQKIHVRYPSLGLEADEIISSIGNVVDADNRTFVVYIKPTKHLKLLKPNLLSIVTANDVEMDDVIKVDTKLIRNDGEGDYIMVVKKTNGSKAMAEKRSIKVLQKFANESIVESGLEPGDQIITEGYGNVINGDEINVLDADQE